MKPILMPCSRFALYLSDVLRTADELYELVQCDSPAELDYVLGQFTRNVNDLLMELRDRTYAQIATDTAYVVRELFRSWEGSALAAEPEPLTLDEYDDLEAASFQTPVKYFHAADL